MINYWNRHRTLYMTNACTFMATMSIMSFFMIYVLQTDIINDPYYQKANTYQRVSLKVGIISEDDISTARNVERHLINHGVIDNE